MSENEYKIVLCDPPWQFNNKNTGGSMISGASAVYPVMSVSDICKLPVPSICDDDCALFMWCVWPTITLRPSHSNVARAVAPESLRTNSPWVTTRFCSAKYRKPSGNSRSKCYRIFKYSCRCKK